MLSQETSKGQQLRSKKVLQIKVYSEYKYSGVLQSTPRILLEALHCHCGVLVQVLPYGIRPS